MLPREFDRFFEQATGHRPYDYQRELGTAAQLPAVVGVPTGSGKTQALLVAWLYGRLVRGSAPRRLVYALPMRSLAEQTVAVAQQIRAGLDLGSEDLPIHVLMGGEPPTDWRERPERHQVLVGTIDMLLSRALNRGYGESRFAWPVAFGLLNSDCRWVFDEVQLMGPGRATSAQLDGLRAKLGTVLPCESVWVSATVDEAALITIDRPDLGTALTLSEGDRNGPLAARLSAQKRLERVDLSGQSASALPRAIAAAVSSHHVPGSRTIVVLNTVGLAQQVAEQLRRHGSSAGGADRPDVVLLHSRFRPPDRAARMSAALSEDGPGRIVVATQVIEAGVDTSARVLATETAPFSSIVQRAGRCNRAGEHHEALVLWLDRGAPSEKLSSRAAAPYDPGEVAAARAALLGLVGSSLSPAALSKLNVAERREIGDVLRRRDLIDLFDTAPDLSGMDVDVSRFIRDSDDRSVSAFFRAIEKESSPAATQPAPGRDELVSVPLGTLGARRAWTFDHVDGVWQATQERALRPSQLVMLDAADGGYDEHRGWTGNARDRVLPLPPPGTQPAESFGSDPRTFERRWVTLSKHLSDAERAAREIAESMGDLDGPASVWDAVAVAAALHDVGKAHPTFQQTLLSAVPEDERERWTNELWAKSAKRGQPHARRHFRHELASALALRGSNGRAASPAGADDPLVVYLVGAHHGRVRMSIRAVPDERPPEEAPFARFALGIVEGDVLPPVETPIGTLDGTTLDLACMELGGAERSWTDSACRLRDDLALGPFRLGFLEAVVRIADWRASA